MLVFKVRESEVFIIWKFVCMNILIFWNVFFFFYIILLYGGGILYNYVIVVWLLFVLKLYGGGGFRELCLKYVGVLSLIIVIWWMFFVFEGYFLLCDVFDVIVFLLSELLEICGVLVKFIGVL